MYNIIQLNDKNLSELQVIAKELGIKKADSFKKEELVYKILDEQAIAGATKKVAAEKLKEERKGDKNKRSRTAAPKKEEKVAPAAKNAEVTKNKENAPAAKPQQQPKEEAANKAKEAPVAEPKAEKAAPKRKVGRPRKDANIAEKAENKEVKDIVFIPGEMRAFVKEREISLTKNELKMLSFFLQNPKQILSKTQLLENVFDRDGDFMDENTVAVNIRRLREKIEEDPAAPVYIKNIRGLGYIWDQEVSQ